jgi:hypothetical protein
MPVVNRASFDRSIVADQVTRYFVGVGLAPSSVGKIFRAAFSVAASPLVHFSPHPVH